MKYQWDGTIFQAKLKMIKALIFDVGGVLTEDVWENMLLHGEEALAPTLGLNLGRVTEVAKSLWTEFAHRSVTDVANWRMLEVEYWTSFTKELSIPQPPQYFIDRTDKFIKPLPGMIDLLAELARRNMSLAICSNNTEFWFARQMDKLNLSRFFEPGNVILSSRIGTSKASPKFEMFEAVVNSLAVDRQDCILIDDRLETVLRSIEFGVTAILFPSNSAGGSAYLKSLFEKLGLL